MLDPPHPTVAAAEHTSRQDLPPLAYRLDALSTWLFMACGVVILCTLVGALLVLTTSIDTLGLVSPQTENKGRFALAVIVFGAGLAGAGIVAGLGGILKALVRKREL